MMNGLGIRLGERFALVVLMWFGLSVTSFAAGELSAIESLGKHLFFDKNLSQPRGQACVSCHDPKTGFSSPSAFVNFFGSVEPGAVKRRAGNRRPPTAAYATSNTSFDMNDVDGGSFWDGRGTGTVITAADLPLAKQLEYADYVSNPAADQAMGPFLNDVEMNLPSAEVLCRRVESSSYIDLWAAAWGQEIDCSQPVFIEQTHKLIAVSIASYEASSEVNSFSSYRDFAIANEAALEDPVAFPLALFTAEQNLGHELFHERDNSCARFCHSSSFGADGTDPLERYSEDSAGYFNIGTPANAFNPWYRMNRVRDDNGNIINPEGRDWVDLGVANTLMSMGLPETDQRVIESMGAFKVPTVRNVAKKPRARFPRSFTHNGYFKSLKSIVHFYNTRDQKPVCRDRHGRPQRFVPDSVAIARGCWPEPEVMTEEIFDCDRSADCKVEVPGLSDEEVFANYCTLTDGDGQLLDRGVGNLCLTDSEEDALVAYLQTLTDTLRIVPPTYGKPPRRKSPRDRSPRR